ncbi:carboxypeptidase-like regulatory domain-containing protein [Mucilaginibacter litoreus]|uniref:Carboxypeptidase-like regulatory domain-containing protein n=1 Tax=Mucilaginibacter litoreus TaxID=1048221 RepID=A0ABW3ARK2_9SPHI
MKSLFLIGYFVITAFCTKAQTLTGVVIDAKTAKPLPYVNIGIIGKSVGTVTAENGTYKLDLSNHPADSLRISMVGYISQAFKIADIDVNAAKTISLQPSLTQLKEVRVSNHKWKQVILGNTTRSKGTNAGFTSGRLGNEIGAVIKIKKSPTYLKRFNASLASEIVVDSIMMRLNFYTVKGGLPDQLLQNQNIFVTVKKGQDLISIDLEPYNIIVEDKFFVSLEWIKQSRSQGIMFSASLFSGAIIARETSQAKWEKEGIAGLGFNVLAEY